MKISKRQLKQIIETSLKLEGMLDNKFEAMGFTPEMIEALEADDKEEFIRLSKVLDSEVAKNIVDDTKNAISDTIEKINSKLDISDIPESEEDELISYIEEAEIACDYDYCDELEHLYDDLEKIEAESIKNKSDIFDKQSKKDNEEDTGKTFTIAGDSNSENNGTWKEIHVGGCRVSSSDPSYGPAGWCDEFYDDSIPPGPNWKKIN